jgi:hypothetical protein
MADIYSDRYTARYTVPGQETYSQGRIYSSSSGYTAQYTQQRIHGGRYTAADTQQKSR